MSYSEALHDKSHFQAPPDFRQLLQTELVRRCKVNPKYSLRAFAKSLEIDVSLLSKILRGKRSLSKVMLLHLSKRLGLGPGEVDKYLEAKTAPERMLPSYQNLTLDYFHVIADWYHFALFELVTLKHFQSQPRWIAQTLGISVSETNFAIERMVRLELLKFNKNGRLIRCVDHITTVGNEFTTVAFRKLQKQVLEMALHALEEIPMELRDQSSMTMAIQLKKLPEFKERIKRFRRKLCNFAEASKEKDHVYQLGISFYPVTKTRQTQEIKK